MDAANSYDCLGTRPMSDRGGCAQPQASLVHDASAAARPSSRRVTTAMGHHMGRLVHLPSARQCGNDGSKFP